MTIRTSITAAAVLAVVVIVASGTLTPFTYQVSRWKMIWPAMNVILNPYLV